MTWTTDTPAAPGWYWTRVPGHAGYVAEVMAMRMGAGKPAELFVIPPGVAELPLAEYAGNEWAGPIPEPTCAAG